MLHNLGIYLRISILLFFIFFKKKKIGLDCLEIKIAFCSIYKKTLNCFQFKEISQECNSNLEEALGLEIRILSLKKISKNVHLK